MKVPMLESAVKNFCQQFAQAPIYIAYSGGVDSQVLLHALSQLKKRGDIDNALAIIHINHGLSPNADKWQAFAQQQAALFDVEFYSALVDVEVKARQSIEAVARDKRYQALQSIASPNACILTGHHQDDQVETLLLALKRGAGIKGLSAMLPLMPFNPPSQQVLARPLLHVARAEIEAYAKQHQLTWIEDESNSDIRFDRNFLRHQVLPLLTERWPSFNATLSRSVSHCQETQSLLAQLAEQDLEFACAQQKDTGNELQSKLSAEPKLNIEALRTLSKARFNNLIRYFLSLHQCAMPSEVQLEQVWQQLNAAVDKNPEVKVGANVLRRYRQWLYLTPDYSDLSEITLDCSAVFSAAVKESGAEQAVCQLPDQLGEVYLNVVNCDQALQSASLKRQKLLANVPFSSSNSNLLAILPPKSGQNITIKFSHQNPKCHPSYRDKPRTLKKVLQELEIAPWQRKRLPMLYYDNELVAVIGVFACNDFVAKSSELFLALDWQTDKKQG